MITEMDETLSSDFLFVRDKYETHTCMHDMF
jgi:hypothetical protein